MSVFTLDNKENVDRLASAIILDAVDDYKANCRRYRYYKTQEDRIRAEHSKAVKEFRAGCVRLGRDKTMAERKEDPEFKKLYDNYLKHSREYNHMTNVFAKISSVIIFFNSAWGSTLCWEFDIDPAIVIESLNKQGWNHLEENKNAG